MPKTLITWYIKAPRTSDNANYNTNTNSAANSYTNWIMSPATIDSAVKMLCKMNYNIQEYELITHHDHCVKWCVVFDLGDEEIDDFRRSSMKTLIQFKFGSFITSSIYVKYDDNDVSGDDDIQGSGNETDDEWEQIYKNKN